MNLLEITIETERLLLKPISHDFAKDIFCEYTAEIAKFMVPKPAEKIEETYESIDKSLAGLRKAIELDMVILKKRTMNSLECAAYMT